jgi:hypothetical protein
MKRNRLVAGMAILAMAAGTRAAVIQSGTLNLSIPATSDGLFVNVQAATVYPGPGFPTFPGPGSNYDFNPYYSSGWQFFGPGSSGMSPSVAAAARGYVAGTTSGPATRLALGAVIGPASVLNTSSVVAGSNFSGQTGYLGFRFRTEPDLAIHYGYALVTLPTTQTAGTLVSYAYESTANTAITIVPEPASLALLGAGVLVLRRRR